MSALFHNDFDRLLRERMMSHGGVDVKSFKESKDFIRKSASGMVAPNGERVPASNTLSLLGRND